MSAEIELEEKAAVGDEVVGSPFLGIVSGAVGVVIETAGFIQRIVAKLANKTNLQAVKR